MRWLLPALVVAVAGFGAGPTLSAATTPLVDTPVRTLVALATPQAQIAKLLVATPISAQPGGEQTGRLGTSVRVGGGPTQLLVLDQRTVDGRRWLRVLLPTRPNGASGWIPSDSTRLISTPWRLIVSLADRRVYAVRQGQVVRGFRVVIGAPATPTPTGSFAIAERLSLPDPEGFYGSWMLTLTAHSNVLDTFQGGDGRVALHGRGGASLAVPVGAAASHGCVRMRNADIAWLARFAQPGTPVEITAASMAG